MIYRFGLHSKTEETHFLVFLFAFTERFFSSSLWVVFFFVLLFVVIIVAVKLDSVTVIEIPTLIQPQYKGLYFIRTIIGISYSARGLFYLFELDSEAILAVRLSE